MATLETITTEILPYIGGNLIISGDLKLTRNTNNDKTGFFTYENAEITADEVIDTNPFFLASTAANNTVLNLTNIFSTTALTGTWGNTSATYRITPNTELLYKLDLGTQDGSHYIRHFWCNRGNNTVGNSDLGTNNVYLILCPGGGASFTGNNAHSLCLMMNNGTSTYIWTDKTKSTTGSPSVGPLRECIRLY